MKAFVTGATGFIGGSLARQLRERGDEVVALVRSPSKAGRLSELGCELVEGDLSDSEAIRAGMEGCDSVFHAAAVYEVGIPKKDRAAMHDANVGGTERVLDAAMQAGVGRIVYVSTVNVFGDTHGEVVDETFERDLSEGFLSTYDETKYLSHEVALDRLKQGAPVVIVQPGGVFGPDDHSEVGNMLEQTAKGKLPAKMMPDTGLCLCHVDDIAGGIILAHDKGAIGEAYVISGEKTRLGDVIDTVAELAGRKPPRFTMPTVLMKLSAPLGPVIGPPLGFNPNLRETIKASAGVTYWATDAKARERLGFAPRPLEQGLRETFA